MITGPGSGDLTGLVERLYPALARGDRAGVEGLLHPSFEAWFSPGLLAPGEGHLVGPAACIERGWWTIGARWAVRAEPARWLACGPDDLVVLGDYTGTSRAQSPADRLPVRAPFAHAWTAEDGLLRTLRQYTDSAQWPAPATPPAPAASR